MRIIASVMAPLGVLIACVLLSACATTDSTSGPGHGGSGQTESAAAAFVGEWTLVSIRGQAIDGPPGDGDVRAPTLRIGADGSVSGFAGVNRYSGSAGDASGIAQGKFVPGSMAVTRMAGPPEAMQLEDSFLAAMGDARSVRREGDALVISGEAGEVLRFEKKGSE